MNTEIKQYLLANPSASKRAIMRKFHIGSITLEALITSESLHFRKLNRGWGAK